MFFSFDAGKPNLRQNFTFGILGPLYAKTQMGYTTTIGFLLLLSVTVTMATTQHINREGVFARLNYGVIFRPRQTIRLVTEEWTHVFIMQLPERFDSRFDRRHIREFNCSEIHDLSNTSCKAFQPLFNSLATLHLTAVNRVHAVINQMYHILPDSYHSRHSRGLFDLGDEFLTPSLVWPPPNNLMPFLLLHVILCTIMQTHFTVGKSMPRL